MRVTISNFGGVIPRRSDHNLPAVSATVAHDVKLRNGRLEAWHNPANYGSAISGAQSFAIVDCCLLSWAEDVVVADLGGRNTASGWGDHFIIVSGRNKNLEMVNLSNCRTRYTSMSLQDNQVLQVASADTAHCDRDYDSRAYMYTYVFPDGSESPPVGFSGHVRSKDGGSCTVSGFVKAENVGSYNLYRASTGFRDINTKNTQEIMTEYFFVANITSSQSSYTDKLYFDQLGPPIDLTRTIGRFAPKGMHNVVSIDGQMRLAATKGAWVYMSEHEHIVNWPIDNDILLDSEIVHMGQLGGKLYVTTVTTPYIITVPLDGLPDVVDLKYNLPDIGKKKSCGACITPYGYVYSSWMGLILIKPNGRYDVITAPWFGEDDWREMSPDTVRLAYWEGYLFCATDTGTFMLDIHGTTYEDMQLGELVTLSDHPIDIHTTNTGQLAMMGAGEKANAVTLWDNGEGLRPFVWTSRELYGGSGTPAANMPAATGALGCNWSPVSAKVRTTNTTFTLSTPIANHPGYTRPVLDEVPFRLPRIGRHMWYKVTFKGTAPVEFFDMGTAHITVNEGV